jgi:hypothetical protein
VFHHWVQCYGKYFAQGESGYNFYCAILEMIENSCTAEAVRAYEDRFLPLLDQNLLHKRIADMLGGPTHSRRHRPWRKKIWRVIRPW